MKVSPHEAAKLCIVSYMMHQQAGCPRPCMLAFDQVHANFSKLLGMSYSHIKAAIGFHIPI